MYILQIFQNVLSLPELLGDGQFAKCSQPVEVLCDNVDVVASEHHHLHPGQGRVDQVQGGEDVVLTGGGHKGGEEGRGEPGKKLSHFSS